MAPAEIIQGGRKVNKIEGRNTHQGVLDGRPVLVIDHVLGLGCDLKVTQPDGTTTFTEYLECGNSKTLDGGEIVKSVRK